MKFKELAGALAIAFMPLQAAAQDLMKVTANVSETQQYVCVSEWQKNPRLRFCYEGDKNFTFGSFIPLSKNKIKIVIGNRNDLDEQGIYVIHDKGRLSVGFGVEHLNDKLSAEAHSRIRINANNALFAGYGIAEGTSTVSAGYMYDIGKNHFAVGVAKRNNEMDKNMGVQFSGKTQLLLYYSIDNNAKFFYSRDENFQSLFGFIRFGEKYIPYTRGAFDADRFDFLQQPTVLSKYWAFHPILPPQNTHLSEQGTVAIAPKFFKNGKTTTYGMEGFHTYKKFIHGYGFEQTIKDGESKTSYRVSTGAIIGPGRVIGSWDSGKGFSISGVLVLK